MPATHRHRTIYALAAAAAAVATTMTATADVIYDTLGAEDGYAYPARTVGLGPGNANVEEASAFTPDADFYLHSIVAALHHRFGPNEATLSIYDSHHGEPWRELESITLTGLTSDIDDLAPIPQPDVFEFSGKTRLLKGHTYYLVASAGESSEFVWYANELDLDGERRVRINGQGNWILFDDSPLGAFRAEGSRVDTSAECPADLDGSGSVDFNDLITLLAAWGTCDDACPADLDQSGTVEFEDLVRLLAHWGGCPIE